MYRDFIIFSCLQTCGEIERQNYTVKNYLQKVLMEQSKEWPRCLEGVLFAHRSTKHSSTGYSPFYLVYGRHPVLPADVEFGKKVEGKNNKEKIRLLHNDSS